jgi:glycosyltransferase involved in cell wall biosynthesis
LAAHESLGAAVPPLVIVGARGWGDDVADSYEASDRVHFVGHVASHELAAVYSGATALCYPSVMEGFGLPILEAMAHGTPVLTSRGTSTEEVAAGAAVLVDSLDVSAIAAGIREVLARRAELSQAGRARASGATWQHTADLVVQAYHEAVEMGSRRT